jgi:hypothetical protein
MLSEAVKLIREVVSKYQGHARALEIVGLLIIKSRAASSLVSPSKKKKARRKRKETERRRKRCVFILHLDVRLFKSLR